MTNESLLIIFTKNPEPGLVKTRLARSIGDKKALEVYEELRHHTALIAQNVAVNRTVCYSHFLPDADIFLTEHFNAQLQVGEDLGERMLNAIQRGFDEGFRRVVLIGTDCYELSAAILDSAFAVLKRADAVVGPASDGGFYLIGLTKPIEELFLGREWSTKEVLSGTIEVLQRLALPYELLPELSDIDTFDDLKKSGLWTEESISIIIPTYNEEAIIAQSIQALLAITEQSEGIEIIVSDASSDGTRKILSEFPVTVCHSEKGRAIQMNTGAKRATGDILYFLHADTLPPLTFIENIRSAVREEKKAGCFRMNFNDSNPIMSLYGWFTQFPLMICRGGDQSLFVVRSLFQEIGGFDETHLVMEDISIINRIVERAEFHILDSEVTTSARRYHQNGIIRLQLLFGTIHLMYASGCDQETIIRYYRENIGGE